METSNIQPDVTGDMPLELGHHASEAFKEQAKAIESAPLPESTDESYESGSEYSPEETIAEVEKPAAEARDDVDDYGNEMPKQEKVYTKAEVEAMMRDRNSRGEFAKQQQPAPQQPAQNFEYDSSNGDSWEAQLEAFNESWFQKREERARYENHQRQEQQTQAEFEVKFNQGASKYQDFEQVVMGKPLTPQMVIATRGMQDPAAFIYAAAKTQAPELERISRLNDPYAQAVELGRLEQRMRQARASVSKAPKPIDAVKGDMTERKGPKTWSIDDKLRQAENESKKERMRGKTM